jgi:hypothetical protein
MAPETGALVELDRATSAPKKRRTSTPAKTTSHRGKAAS